METGKKRTDRKEPSAWDMFVILAPGLALVAWCFILGPIWAMEHGHEPGFFIDMLVGLVLGGVFFGVVAALVLFVVALISGSK